MDDKPKVYTPSKPAAAMVFWRGASMPTFRLVPITVVDFYPRKPS